MESGNGERQEMANVYSGPFSEGVPTLAAPELMGIHGEEDAEKPDAVDQHLWRGVLVPPQVACPYCDSMLQWQVLPVSYGSTGDEGNALVCPACEGQYGPDLPTSGARVPDKELAAWHILRQLQTVRPGQVAAAIGNEAGDEFEAFYNTDDLTPDYLAQLRQPTQEPSKKLGCGSGQAVVIIGFLVWAVGWLIASLSEASTAAAP